MGPSKAPRRARTREARPTTAGSLSPLNRRLAYLDGTQQPPRLARPPPARTSKRLSTSETLSTYNEAGLLESIAVRIRGSGTATSFVSDFDYDAKNQRLRCVHGNGTATTYTYDSRTFRLTRLRLVRDVDAALLQDLQYTYDPVGNISEIRDGAQQAVYFANAVVSADQRFEYDAMYRLTRAEGREHASLGQPTHEDLSFGPQRQPNNPAALRRYEQEYAWDSVGNLAQLRHVAGAGSFTRRYVYAAAGNRLLANSAPGEALEPFSHSYTYDEHGNMTSMPHLAAMAWDHADRLQHCDLGGGGDVRFVYDAAGERVRKVQVNTSGSAVRERIYIGGYEVYRERAANSATPDVERQTLHVGDDRGKLALVETLTVDAGTPVAAPTPVQRHQHGNHLGSASLELAADAAVISYEEYHPFGTSSYAANNAGIEVSAKRYRYIGKERDEETGLYRLGARYYASWLGRWTAADPIGLGDGVNRYAYSRGSPIRFRDRSGNQADGGILGDLLEQQGALLTAIVNAGSAAERELLGEEVSGVARELAAELKTHKTRARSSRDLGELDAMSGTAQRHAEGRAQATMSTGAADDAYMRSQDPRDLLRAEMAQMRGLGGVANVAFQKASARLEEWGVVDPMSDSERRTRALSAGDALDNLTAFPAGTGARGGVRIHRGRPLKNLSGNLDVSARARRTEPHGATLAARREAPRWVESLPAKVRTQIDKAQLPLEGETPFRPRLVQKRGQTQIDTAEVLHGPRKGEVGRVDTEGQIWLRDKPHAGYPAHWDVQLDGGRSHLNVGFDGNPVKRN